MFNRAVLAIGCHKLPRTGTGCHCRFLYGQNYVRSHKISHSTFCATPVAAKFHAQPLNPISGAVSLNFISGPGAVHNRSGTCLKAFVAFFLIELACGNV